MNNGERAEYTVWQIETAVDDLTSLAHDPDAASVLRVSNLEGIERRLRELRFDLMAMAEAAE